MILETTFETATGAVCLVDFMTRREGVSDLVRIVKGLRGNVAMRTELVVRFEYGSVVPWVSRRHDGRREITAGPDRLFLASDIPLRGEDFRTVGEFDVAAGDEIGFTLSWSTSYDAAPTARPASDALAQAEQFWTEWSARFKPRREWSGAVMRSLLTLKALSHRETGGIVAAGTTSLPEKIGGNRNWDYRYCWLRDATFTLYALLGAGFIEEAKAWRGWLLRAVAGSPRDLQIMYGVAGERRLEEYEVSWLKGYEASSPVRIGNAAAKQIQLDVYGELLDALYVARKAGLHGNAASWTLECSLIEHLETVWDQPDDGIWEVRGGRKHFTHSKVMAWVAFDRAIRSVEEFGMAGPLLALACYSRGDSRAGLRARIRQRTEQLRTVLRFEIARRQSVADPDGRLPAAVRSPHSRHGDCSRKGVDARRFRAAVSHARGGRRAATGRGGLSGLQLLACGQLRPAGAARRGAATIRTASVPAQRCRSLGRGV